jgi:hypothetical protein
VRRFSTFNIYYWFAMHMPKWLVRMALYRAGWTMIKDDEVVPEVTFMDVLQRA